MDNTKISESIFKVLNELFSKLFSSVDNKIYNLLDKITFIDASILEDGNFKKIIGENSSEGILVLGNAFVFGIILFFSLNYLLSNLTMGKSEKPTQFIFKGIIFIALMNSSLWICSELINIVSISTRFILNMGSNLFSEEICFSKFIELINKEVYATSELNIFSFEGIVKSFTSLGLINLVFSNSLRYIMIQIFVIISPFSFLCLMLEKTEWFFRVWIKMFLSLILEQILIAIILTLAFSIKNGDTGILQLLYIGIIYALMRTNTFMRQIFGGLYTSVSNNLSSMNIG